MAHCGFLSVHVGTQGQCGSRHHIAFCEEQGLRAEVRQFSAREMRVVKNNPINLLRAVREIGLHVNHRPDNRDRRFTVADMFR